MTILPTVSTWIFTSMVPVGLPVLAVLQTSAYSTSRSNQSSSFNLSTTILIADSTSLSWCLSRTCASTSSLTSSGPCSAQTWCLLYLVRKQWDACTHKILISGGVSYSKLLPRGSYIDALNQSPKNLAHFLRWSWDCLLIIGKYNTGTWTEVTSCTPAICSGKIPIGWKHR